MPLKDIIMPLACSSKYNDVYKKIDSYLRSKLSLDNILKESNEFKKLKMYLLSSEELYVLENIDRFRKSIVNDNLSETFDFQKFKSSHQQAQSNIRFIKAIE
jgi:hypothetical protein